MTHRYVILLVLAISAAEALGAQRTFVSAATGVDTNPCTRAQPCRSFAAALSFTDADGELIAIDSGGYGTVVISQPVSLIAPKGVQAGITATAGTAVVVNASDTAHVVLKNLSINSLGASIGITAYGAVTALYVEECTIRGFNSYGLSFSPSTSDSRLSVSNTRVEYCGSTGILVVGATLHATLESVQLYQNNYGFAISSGQAAIRNMVANGADQQGGGFTADQGAKVVIEDSVSSGSREAFYAAAGSIVVMTRCTATSNSVIGVYALNNAVIYVSDSTIMMNAYGVGTATGGMVNSRGNNTLMLNTTDGVFNNSFSAQ